ncbi:von Willebrand factor A domain containing 5A [Thecamonas trahens ATCC 50062]|uniref:von Willebrand factor A domain containing 5A n=1 Tax=Thecamonas trahens ATCC 50062 TaxID=461836 RepID=A0A0L0DMR7_THETB|nr:von Willebrand factor A domain containing 5A [Thecamonas trahens ATCC 50062]KNC53592.1 von Willebrand factor A domain containing 5A [Thecamonas trahens ATCC 50062]|eukprot:XP_013761909.1 von Willebrand factor A domain containing 5A [Thecamonas trahens ATCC 50062]
MSSQQEKVAMFQGITGASEATTRQFLSRAGWNAEMALSNYFEAGLEPETVPVPVAPPVNATGPADEDPLVGDEVCALVAAGTRRAMPLVGATVHAVVLDLAADVDVVFRFVNDSDDALEASFVFRNDDVAICGFEAQVGDLQIEGVVQEKQAARAAYTAAVAAGDGAFLLEQGVNESVLVLAIGNVLPHQSVLIRLRYVIELELERDAVVLPISLARLPLADPASLPDAAPDDAATAEVPPGLAVTVAATMPSAIHDVVSLTHDVRTERESDERVHVTVERPLGGEVASAPLVVRFHLDAANQPRLECQASGLLGDDALAFTIVPEAGDLFDASAAELGAQRAELIFLVDRSGSMAGSRMNQAKNALQLFLRSIPMGSKFNIVSFGSRYEKLFASAVEYNDRSLTRARAAVAGMKADLNQTDILPPLRDIFASEPEDGVPRQLLILTDGEVPNTSEVLTFARNAASETRVFTFGIGAEASRTLVKGLARAGRGYAEFVVSGERIEPVVARQLRRALQPAITNARIDWGGLADKVVQCPAALPPIFAGQAFTVFALVDGDRAEGAVDNVHTVALVGDTPMGGFDLALEFNIAEDVVPGDLLHRIAARNLIKQLERNVGKPGPAGKAARNRVVHLATKYSLISSCTSFVALDKRDAETRRAAIRTNLARVDLDPAASAAAAASEAGVRDLPDSVGVAVSADILPTEPGPMPISRDAYADTDTLLDSIEEAIERQYEISSAIGQELHNQNNMLNEVAAPPPPAARSSDGFFSALRSVFSSSSAAAAPPPAPRAAPAPPPGAAMFQAMAPPPPIGGAPMGSAPGYGMAQPMAYGGGGSGGGLGGSAGYAGAAPPPMRRGSSGGQGGGSGRVLARAKGSRARPPAMAEKKRSSSPRQSSRRSKALGLDTSAAVSYDYTGSGEQSLASPAWAELEAEGTADGSLFGAAPMAAHASRGSLFSSDDDEDGSTAGDEAFSLILDAALRPVDKIIMLQSASGAWPATEALASVLGVPVRTGAPDGASDDAWATALVLAHLAATLANDEDEWALLAQKAKHWLRKQLGDRCQAVLDAAVAVIGG